MNKSAKNQKWLTAPIEQLVENKNDEPTQKMLDRFLEMGLPVLKKCKSGFFAEMGDIQTCLLIHLEEDGKLKTELCSLTESGELESRIVETDLNASNMIKSFATDYPDAVFTTSERKPLCLFSSKEENLKRNQKMFSDDKEYGTMGMFMGYMNFATFRKILSLDKNKIVVAVP